MAYRLAVCALLSSSAAAQPEQYARLIFEVAPIPEDAAAGIVTGGVATGAAQAAADSSANNNSPNTAADIRAYQERIRETQANENPYSAALREQYDALGSLLQQSGQHADAIAAFESAMHIDRVNGGLYTLDQIPLVKKIIASHSALGNFSEVDDFHEYLFYIQQKSIPPGDPRLLAAKEEWADWNVEAYLKEGVAEREAVYSFNTSASMTNRTDYVAVQSRDGSYVYVPREQMHNVLNPTGAATNAAATDFMLRSSAFAVPAEQVIDKRLRTARKHYEDIVDARTADASAAAAADDYRVEHKLANIAYAVKKQIDSMETVVDEGSLHYNRVFQPRTEAQVVTRGYRENRDTLEAIAQQVEQDPAASIVEKAQAWIHVGDWHVGFDAAQSGQDAYHKAWELLHGAGMDEAAITAVFLPRLMIPVPEFAVHEYSRGLYNIGPDEALAYKGYMDLTLDINRYGDIRGVKIDAASPDTQQFLRSTLLDFLRAQKMRPAVVNGETVARENLKLRYYYTY